VEALDVPIYLHPRSPLPNQRRVYEGYPVLADAPWGFGAETAAHTLRLILSGLFDRFPRLKVILGHQVKGCRSSCRALSLGCAMPVPTCGAGNSSQLPSTCAKTSI
jgi:gamma-resorcylate decarboxylase